jgi:recombination protein RecA
VRKRLKQQSYFEEELDTQFLPSGCTLLDCILGGGYPLGRVVNLVGDKSSNKTGLAVEACANFAVAYPQGKIWYGEFESAFSRRYAKKIGLPDRTEFVTKENVRTVEDLFINLTEKIKECADTPGVYIIDSLDALSDASELEREIDKGSYGSAKAKKMSELFRRLVDDIERSKILLFIVSQERDKINVSFGRKSTRSGGRALDFYASQIVWLAEVKKIRKTKNGLERSTGIWVRAKCEKNKVGLPFRECDFPVIFYYGVQDIEASLQFLNKVKMLDKFDSDITSRNISIHVKKIMKDGERKKELKDLVKKIWDEIEVDFLPTESKYE